MMEVLFCNNRYVGGYFQMRGPSVMQSERVCMCEMVFGVRMKLFAFIDHGMKSATGVNFSVVINENTLQWYHRIMLSLGVWYGNVSIVMSISETCCLLMCETNSNQHQTDTGTFIIVIKKGRVSNTLIATKIMDVAYHQNLPTNDRDGCSNKNRAE